VGLQVVLLDLKSSILREVSACPRGPKAVLFRLAQFLFEAMVIRVVVLVWICNHLSNQYLSPLKLWARISFMVRCAWYSFLWLSLSVTCGKSANFSGYSGFLHQCKVCTTTRITMASLCHVKAVTICYYYSYAIGKPYERDVQPYIGPGPGEPKWGPWISDGPHSLNHIRFILIFFHFVVVDIFNYF
jgi:hypothetical protein